MVYANWGNDDENQEVVTNCSLLNAAVCWFIWFSYFSLEILFVVQIVVCTVFLLKDMYQTNPYKCWLIIKMVLCSIWKYSRTLLWYFLIGKPF